MHDSTGRFCLTMLTAAALAWPFGPLPAAEEGEAAATPATEVAKEEVPALDPDVEKAIVETALDDDEAAFLRERLAAMKPVPALKVLSELAELPKFDAAAATREFNQKTPAPEIKYSPLALAKTKAEADRRFTPFRRGDTITVNIPYGGTTQKFTGEHQGLFEIDKPGSFGHQLQKVKIGGRFFMVSDFLPEEQERFDEKLMAERHHDFMQREFYLPRKTYQSAYQDLLKRHLEERLETCRDDRRQLVRARINTLPGEKPDAPKE